MCVCLVFMTQHLSDVDLRLYVLLTLSVEYPQYTHTHTHIHTHNMHVEAPEYFRHSTAHVCSY